MIRLKSIDVRDTGSMLRRMLASNISFCVFAVAASLALYFGWRYLDQHAQTRKIAIAAAAAKATAVRVATPAIAEPAAENAAITAPAAEIASTPASLPEVATSNVPAPMSVQAGDQLPAATLPPKVEENPGSKYPDTLVAEKSERVSFSDSLMSVFSPSAKAAMIQPQMPPPPKTATRAASHKTTAHPINQKPLTAEEQRLKVAQSGLEEVMAYAKNFRDIYGFRNSDDLEAAKLGEPIPVCVLAQPSRTSYQGQPVKSLLKPAEEWFFPIVLHERVRYFVLVQRSGQDFVLGHGSRALAMAYEKIQARWPASEGYHPQLILLPNTPFYYFNIPELPFENITDTSRMFDSNPDISPAGVQLGSWR